jgi:hypothetical protein
VVCYATIFSCQRYVSNGSVGEHLMGFQDLLEQVPTAAVLRERVALADQRTTSTVFMRPVSQSGGNYLHGRVYWALTPEGRRRVVEVKLI